MHLVIEEDATAWLHYSHHRVSIIRKNSHDSMHLVIEEDTAAWLQLILIHEAEDGHIMLTSHAGGDDSMIVVDNFLKVAHTHGCSSQIINLATFFFVLFLLGLQSLLIPDELLLH